MTLGTPYLTAAAAAAVSEESKNIDVTLRRRRTGTRENARRFVNVVNDAKGDALPEYGMCYRETR